MNLTRPNSAIADLVEATYRKRRSFEAGFTLRNPREVLLLAAEGNYYQWKGTFPKVVPANSTPATTGGISSLAWQNVGTADDIAIINAKFTAVQQQIDDLSETIPEAGKSAYQIALDNGFVGTEAQWLASLKGDTGAQLNIKGSLASTSELPSTGNVAGDGYIVGDVIYAWDGSVWKLISSLGPEGKSAYEVWLADGNTGSVYDFLTSIKGDKGDIGPTGPQGAPGVNANGFDYRGDLPSTSNLPQPNSENVSQAYSINGNLYVSNGTAWVNMGNIVGPQGPQGEAGKDGLDGTDGDEGKSAYQSWLDAGNEGTEVDFIASLKGPKGDKGDQGERGPQGELGPQGPVGATGSGLEIIGVLNSEAELPPTGEVGDAYKINNDLYVWIQDATEWMNVGSLGGTSITAKGHVPNSEALPVYNNYGDAYLTEDTSNLYIYTYDQDTNSASFVDMGSIKGDKGEKGDKGDKGDPGTNGTNGTDGTNGKDGAQWFVATTNPVAGDGVINDYAFNTTTGAVFKKTDSSTWTLIGTLPSIPEAPQDGLTYGRSDGNWIEISGSDPTEAITPTKVTAGFMELETTTANSGASWTPSGTSNMYVVTVTDALTVGAWPGVTGSTKPKAFSAMIYLIQDTTGHTVTLDASYGALNDTEIATTANAVTILQLTYPGVGDIVDMVVVTR